MEENNDIKNNPYYQDAIDNPEPAQQQPQQDQINPNIQDNPYYEDNEEHEKNNRVKYNQSIMVADKVTPQQQTEVNQLSREFKLPKEFVGQNVESFRAESRKKLFDYDIVKKENPYLAEWLTTTGNASLAHKKLAELKAVDSKASKFIPSTETLAAAVKGGSGQSVLSAKKSFHYAALMDGGSKSSAQEIANLNKEIQNRPVPKFYQEHEKRMASETEDLSRVWDDYANLHRTNMDDDILESLWRSTKTVGSLAAETYDIIDAYDFKSGVYEATQSLDTLVVPTAVGAGTGLAFSWAGGPVGFAGGFLAGSMASTGVVMYAKSIEQYLVKYNKGIDLTDAKAIERAFQNPEMVSAIRKDAAIKAVSTSAIEGAFTFMGGKILSKALSGTAKTVLGGVAKKTAGAVGAVGLDGAGEGIGEVGSTFAVEGVITAEDFAGGVREGVTGLFLGGGMGSIALGLSGAETTKKVVTDTVKKAKKLHEEVIMSGEFAQDLQDLNDLVGETAGEDLDPQALGDLVEGASQGASLYMQADEFTDHWVSLGESAVEKADELLPGGRKDLETATQEGSPLKVSVRDFISKFAKEDSFKSLTEKVRRAPEVLNALEGSEIGPKLPGLMNHIAKEAKKIKKAEDTKVKLEAKVTKDISQQLQDAGRPKKEANSQAALYTAQMSALGQLSGRTAEEMATQIGLVIGEFKEVPGSAALKQESEVAEGETIIGRGYHPELDNSESLTDKDIVSKVVATPGRAEIFEEQLVDTIIDTQATIKKQGGKMKADTDLLMKLKDAETLIKTIRSIKDTLPTKPTQDPNIYKQQDTPKVEQLNIDPLGFFSNLEKIILTKYEGKTFNTPAKNLLAEINNMPGVKAEELYWTGVVEYLEGLGNDKVSKDQLITFIRDNGVRISQVVLGGSSTEGGGDGQWSEPTYVPLSEADPDGFNEMVYEEANYYLEEDDNFIESERPAVESELRKEMQDELAPDEEIDEADLESRILYQLREIAEGKAAEYLDSEDSERGYYSVDYEFGGVDLNIEYNEDYESYYLTGDVDSQRIGVSSIEEAQIQALGIAREEGLFDDVGDVPAFLKWEDVHLSTHTKDSAATHWVNFEDAKVEFAAQHEETIKARVENEFYVRYIDPMGYWGKRAKEGDPMYSPEELEKMKKREVSQRINKAVRGRYARGFYGKPIEKFRVDPFDGVLIINPKGQSSYISDQHREHKFTVTSVEEGKTKLKQILTDLRAIQEFKAEGEEEGEGKSIAAIDVPKGASKWGTYTVKGGENYREVLMTLPDTDGVFNNNTHFQTDNYVTHLRLKDRFTEDGKKVLFVEELQSDWHQQGRQQGYKRKLTDEEAQRVLDLGRQSSVLEKEVIAAIHTARDEAVEKSKDRHAEFTAKMVKDAATMVEDLDGPTGDKAILNDLDKQEEQAINEWAAHTRDNAQRYKDLLEARTTHIAQAETYLRDLLPGFTPKGTRDRFDNDSEGMTEFLDDNLSGGLGGAAMSLIRHVDIVDLQEMKNNLEKWVQFSIKGRLALDEGIEEAFLNHEGLKTLLVEARATAIATEEYENQDTELNMASKEAEAARRRHANKVGRLEDLIHQAMIDSVLTTAEYVVQNDLTDMTEPDRIRLKQNEVLKEKSKLERIPFSDIPNAPFKKTQAWVELAMKNLLRIAVSQGYESIGWTIGDIHAKRWNTFSHIQSINYKKVSDTQYQLWLKDNDGKVFEMMKTPDEMSEIFREKEIVDAILNDEGTSEGQEEDTKQIGVSNFKVDDQSLSKTYDSIMPKALRSITKKMKGKVGYKKVQATAIGTDSFTSEEIASKAGSVDAKGQEYLLSHHMEITPKIKEEVLKGLPMFQKEDGKPRGFVDVDHFGGILLGLLKGANQSTVLHEMGHAFLESVKLVESELRVKSKLAPDQQAFIEAIDGMVDHFGLESTAQIETIHHEEFARLFEAYLMDGQAPTAKLQKIFNEFRTWLINIYKDIRGLERAGGQKLNLSPQMREMFDRMLATDEEIREANNDMNYSSPEDFATQIGIKDTKTAKGFTELKEAGLEAGDEATAVLYRQQVEQAKTKELKPYKADKKALITKFEAIAEQIPVFIARDAIKDGVEGFETIKMNTKRVKELLTTDEFKSFPRSMYSSEGIDPDITADVVGFESGKDLIAKISATPKKEEWVKAKAKIELDRKYPNFMNPEQEQELKVAALDAVHSDKNSEYMKLQLKFMFNNSPTQYKNLMERLAKKLPSDRQLKKKVERVIGESVIEESRPVGYQRLETKNRSQTMVQANKGDFEKAVEHKLLEIYNHELYKEASQAAQDVDKNIKNSKKRFSISDAKINKKKFNNDMFKVAQAILAQYGILTDVQVGRVEEYLKQLEVYDAAAFSKVSGLTKALSDIAPMSYKKLTHEQFNDVMDVVETVYNLSESENNILVDGLEVNTFDAIDEMGATLAKQTSKKINKEDTSWKKFKGAVASGDAMLTRVEHLTHFLDEADNQGAFTKYVWNIGNEAQLDYTEAYSQELEKLIATLKGPLKGLTQSKVKIDLSTYFKGVDPDLAIISKSELFMMLLHSGNKSNKKKLLLGRNLGTEDLEGNLVSEEYDRFIQEMFDKGIVDKDLMDGVQAIWDQFETFKPRLQKSYKRVTGTFFNEIEANTFKTPWGDYRGGYAPAITDSLLVEAEASRENEASVKNQQNQFTFAQTPRGMTKERVAAYNKALSLDFSLIKTHVEKAVRFATIEPALYDMNKIFNNKPFQDQMFSKHSDWRLNTFIPWMNRLETQKTSIPSASKAGRYVTGVLNHLRTATTASLMFFNIPNTIEQVVDFGPLLLEVDGKSMARIASLMTTDKQFRKDTIENIKTHSRYMDQRLTGQMFVMADQYKELAEHKEGAAGKLQTVQDFAKAHTFILQSTMDNMMTITAWSAAYDAALVELGDTKKAARKADNIIRRIMGSGRPTDVSNVEAGHILQKLVLTFYGYFNNKGNLVRYSQKGQKGKYYSLGMAIPAIGSAAIMLALKGKFKAEGEEDDFLEDAGDVLVWSQLKFGAATVPFAGSLSRWAAGQVNDVPYDNRLGISPTIGGVESAIGVVNVLSRDEIRGRDVRDAITFLGIVSGLPLRPVGKSIGFMIDLDKGTQRADTPLDYARGLSLGRSGKK